MGVLDTCSRRMRGSGRTRSQRRRSGVDHRNEGHTDADFSTPIGDVRRSERRNIADDRRLPKPAFLWTIDAPRRTKGGV